MKIKIKLKNLIKLSIITLFIVFILVPYTTLEIAKYLDTKGSDKAIAFYESYLKKTVKLQNDNALYNYATSLSGETDKYTIMMMGWGGGADTTLDGLLKAKISLEKIINRGSQESEFYSKAYSKIMDICINLQDSNELLNWIEWGNKNTDAEINYISDLYSAFYHYANRDYEMADKVLEGYDITNKVVDNRYYLIKGEIALFKEDFESAKRYFELSNSFNTSYRDSLFGSRSYIGRDYWFGEYNKTIKGKYKVRGRVEFNGKPMPFVEVYIQDDTSFRTGGNDHIAITDINGEYETLGVRPGNYQIGIGLSNSQLYDRVYLRKNLWSLDLNSDMVFDYIFNSPINLISPKPGTIVEGDSFKVEWDGIPGAAYYTVELTTLEGGAVFKTPIIDGNGDYRIKSTIAEFDINKSRNNIGGLSFDGEEMLLQPMGILGNILPGKEHPIIVNAYDENSDLIGSTLPLNSLYENIPSIKVMGSITDGEKLISDMKYEEAINYYEDLLQRESDNKEALVYLSKIYMIGWKEGQQNFEKAIEYVTRYKELTNDYNLSLEVVGFMNHESRINNKRFIENLFDKIPVDLRNEDYYFQLGEFYISMGEYEKSRDAYMDYAKMTTTNIPDNILYLDLYLKDFGAAINILSNNKFNPIRMSKHTLIDSINGLETDNIEVLEYELFKSFLKKTLTHNLKRLEGKELFNSIYNRITSSNLRSILNEIKLEMYWDQEY